MRRKSLWIVAVSALVLAAASAVALADFGDNDQNQDVNIILELHPLDQRLGRPRGGQARTKPERNLWVVDPQPCNSGSLARRGQRGEEWRHRSGSV